ncbi:MAG: putative metal-dependent hydrolase [Acidobacteria bacterium]|nr:putative metal-dependent hydrolase [Acidobacteriota bacterium]
MAETLEQLRYPIGPWKWPETVADGDVERWIAEIAAAPAQLRAAVEGLSPEQIDTRYRPEGWTVRQVVHHMADSHLNSQCRFRWALTEEAPTIKPYDQPKWAELSDARLSPIEPSLDLLDALHLRWVALAESLSAAERTRIFFHPEHPKPLRLDKTLGMYAWHGKHHMAHITSLRARNGWV